VLSTPNGAQLEKALAQLDFMSASTLSQRDTRHAHVIFPPTQALEQTNMT